MLSFTVFFPFTFFIADVPLCQLFDCTLPEIASRTVSAYLPWFRRGFADDRCSFLFIYLLLSLCFGASSPSKNTFKWLKTSFNWKLEHMLNVSQCLDSHCTQTFIFNERKVPLTKPSLIGIWDCQAVFVRHNYSTEAVIHCFQPDGCREVNKRPKLCLAGGIASAVEKNLKKILLWTMESI